MVLDSSGADRFSFPGPLKHIAQENLSSAVSQNKLLVSAAMAQLAPKGPTRTLDYLDFQAAMFSLIFAKEFNLAAKYWTVAIPSLYTTIDFSLASMFFVILNGEIAQKAISDDYLRWQLLIGELFFRAQNVEAAKEQTVVPLLRRLRSIANRQPAERRWFYRITMLIALSAIRNKRVTETQDAKIFAHTTAPLILAIRIAIRNKAAEFINVFAGFFRTGARWLRTTDIDLLKDTVLFAARTGTPAVFSPNRLTEIYARFAVKRAHSAEKQSLLAAHAREFQSANVPSGYIAAMYGLALIQHEHFDNYSDARAILESICESATRVPQSQLLIARIKSFIADTYWAETDYTNSVRVYEDAIRGHHRRRVRQHIQERLIDSLIQLREFDKAIREVVRILRIRRSALDAMEKSQLYGRLAYAYAETGNVFKAAIAARALDRVARESGSEALQCLALYVASWVLQHESFDDTLIPRSQVEIPDSMAISNQMTAEQLEVWRKEDPYGTKARLQIAGVFELRRLYGRSAALLTDTSSQPVVLLLLRIVPLEISRFCNGVHSVAARSPEHLEPRWSRFSRRHILPVKPGKRLA